MNEEQAIQKISDGISNMLHGPGREQVLQALQKDDSPKAVAMMLYKPARQSIDQAEQSGLNVDQSFIFAVVTDAIDMILEILQAMGKAPKNEDQFRQAVLMQILMIHAAQTPDDPEQQAQAQEDLQSMKENGTLDQAKNIVSQQARDAGLSPDEFASGAQDMMAPKERPVAAGVREGLQ